MRTTTGKKKSSPLAIVRKPFGAVFRGGPFKPTAKGVKSFIKAIGKAVTCRNSEAVETINHRGLSNAAPDEVPIFAKPSTEQVAHPDVSSPRPIGTTTQVDVVTKRTVDTTKPTITVVAQCTLLTEATPVLNIESPLEISRDAIVTEDITPLQGEETVACAEVMVAPTERVSPPLDITSEAELVMPEPTPVAETFTTIDSASDSPVAEAESSEVPTIVRAEAPEVATIVCIEPVAIKCALDTNLEDTQEPTQTVPPHEDTIFNTEVTALNDQEPTVQDIPPAANTDAVPAVMEDSDTDDQAVVGEILQNDDDLEVETDTESEAEEVDHPLGIYVMGASHKGEEAATTPKPAVPVYPVIYEDDYDAAVSSTIDVRFEEFFNIGFPWSVPQLVERKAKSDREILQEGLANRPTPRLNPRNVRLAKAARELTIDGPLRMQDAEKATAPSTIQEVETRPVDEAGTPTTQMVETPSKHRTAEGIQMMRDSASWNHSRSSSSGSSVASASSTPCPDTPVTEYSLTPTKGEAVAGANAGKIAPIRIMEETEVVGAEHTVGLRLVLNPDAHEQYLTASPDGEQVDTCFLPPNGDSDGEEAEQTSFDTDEFSSEASSDFVENPEDEDDYQADVTPEPFERPSTPEPTSEDSYTADYKVDDTQEQADQAEENEEQAEQGSDVFDFAGVECDHFCAEGCFGFLDVFGWDLLRREEVVEGEGDETLIGGDPYDDRDRDMEGECRDEGGLGLECIPEDDESDIEMPDMELLNRIAAKVEEGGALLRAVAAEQKAERATAESAAKVNQVSFWDREPSCATSNMSWADIDEYDDEPEPTTMESTAAKATQSEGAAKVNHVSFWDREPSCATSSMSWADIDEYDDEPGPTTVGGTAAKATELEQEPEQKPERDTEEKRVSFWDREPSCATSSMSWADIDEFDD
ncbi:uncharacterized protein B0H64DRAFT_447633 [Chaetomium fimeti]|uniref:Uncharacterized protein n=1 Tax=Chaetomium fimeti TaxID=1854472 RepID=A0AAE0HP53_9PEZI|nr:hypothetical protein B0H64DRAFT_447633 [Chaetomium fimeti]